MNFSVVRERTVQRIVREDMEGCMRVVRDAYLAHDEQTAVSAPSVFLRFPQRPAARIIALPAHVSGAAPVSGIKWIASYPSNHARSLPRASAVVILNDAETGFPFACLEGSVISAARTAASAALAAAQILGSRWQAVESLGVVGAGYIARNVCEFLWARGLRPKRVLLHDLSADAGARFSDWARELWPNGEAYVCETAESVLRGSELTLFATLAQEPHVLDVSCLRHSPVVLHLSLRDLGPRLILAAANVVDDSEHVMNAGTSVLLASRVSDRRDIVTCTLADLIKQRCSLDPAKPVVFSPFGLGVLDVALAHWVYRRAVDMNEVVNIDDFFALPG